MTHRFVVIGGVAAGLSAAAKAKRDNPDLDVIVFERGEWVSYAACGLPYYVKRDVEELDALVAVHPEEFRDERDIDLRTSHDVLSIDPEAKVVAVDGSRRRFEQTYDSLLIATGARAIELPIAGIRLRGVFTLRNMRDGDAIEQFISTHEPERAVIVGGGYLGVEMAEALVGREIDVTMFEMESHMLGPFGEATARVVEDHLRDRGVDLHLDTTVHGLQGTEFVRSVELDEESVATDIVIVGVGAKPNVELAQEAGIKLGSTGAIATNAYGETNIDDIYAAGDCAEATNVVTGNPDWVPLGLTANRAGRAVGATVAGNPSRTGKIAGTAIVKAFDLGAARTGIVDDVRAREAGFTPTSVTIDAPTRSGYYPGSSELTVTLVADESSGRVLGCSLVGSEGVKRIDTVATALHGEYTVTEVEHLDLAYAPPFSPVWDPILTSARVLGGKVKGRT